MKRWSSRGYFLSAVTGTVGWPAICAAQGDTYTLRMSVPTAATSTQGVMALRLARAVENRSNGRLKIEVYPSGQLAKQQESVDAVSTGVVDLTIQASPFFAQLVPLYSAFDLPFLFDKYATGFRVLDGPIGHELLAALETKGMIGLGLGAGSFKELETTDRSVSVPDDLKGLRIRSESGGVFATTFRTLGAIPTPIDITELFTAIAQHTVDAFDTSLDTIVIEKYYTAAKHVAMTNHIFNVLPLVVNKRKTESLPQPLQTILKEEGRAVIPFMRNFWMGRERAAYQTLQKNGVVFSEIQYPLFRKAVEPVYAAVQSRMGGDLIDRIRRASA